MSQFLEHSKEKLDIETKETIFDNTLGEKEHENIIVRKSALAQGHRLLLFFLSILLMMYLSVEFPFLVKSYDLNNLVGFDFTIDLPILALFPIFIIARVIHSSYNFKYILCEDYILAIDGIISLRRNTLRLHYIHIRTLEIHQTIYHQLLNLGDILLESDIGNHTAEITMKGVVNPHHYKDIIHYKMEKKIRELAPGVTMTSS